MTSRMSPQLDHNEEFARSYTPVPLGMPAAQVIVVTCLDHRVDPAITLGLELIDDLRPRHVVAGHKDSSMPDDTGAIQRTRDYITTFAALLEQQPRTREEFFDRMLRRFPGYANPKALWRSIVALAQDQ